MGLTTITGRQGHRRQESSRCDVGRPEVSPFSQGSVTSTHSRNLGWQAVWVCGGRGRPEASPRVCGSGFSGRGAAGKTSLHLSSFGSRTVSSSTTLMMMMVMMISCAAAGRGVSLRKSGLCISRYTVDVSLRKPGLCTSRNNMAVFLLQGRDLLIWCGERGVYIHWLHHIDKSVDIGSCV